MIHARLHQRDPISNQSTVCLKLRLSRSSRADAATCPREVRPEASQTRQLILQLCKFDLESPFVRSRMHGKDVEDEATAIDHLHLEDLLKPALLCRREFVVCDDQREASFNLRRKQFSSLARPDIGVWIWVPSLLPLRTYDFGTGRLRQICQLLEAIDRGPAGILAALDRNEERALGWRRNRNRCSP
jgi:hypothetical protein